MRFHCSSKKPFKCLDFSQEEYVNLHCNIYLGEWADMKPAMLKKLEPRFMKIGKFISCTIATAKARYHNYKTNMTGKW